MKKIAIIISRPPHGTAFGREALDAALACSSYNEISLFFIGYGVFHLLSNQQPAAILARDYIAAMKLLELYDINHCYVCREDLEKYQIVNPAIKMSCQNRSQIAMLLHSQDSIIRF